MMCNMHTKNTVDKKNTDTWQSKLLKTAEQRLL